MRVKAILDRKGRHVATVRPDVKVSVAARRLIAEEIGALVVSEDGRRPQGLIGERDIVRGLTRFGDEALDRPVAELMTRQYRSCSPDDEIKRVMQEMTRFRMRHLPVLEDGRLCGLVSIGDVVKHRLEDLELETSVLRDVYIASH